MRKFSYIIRDEGGLHARPAGLLCKKAQSYSNTIFLFKGEQVADAKRLFSVMSLGAKKGDAVEFQITGEHEETVAAELGKFCIDHL